VIALAGLKSTNECNPFRRSSSTYSLRIYLTEALYRYVFPWARHQPEETTVTRTILHFLRDETGATAIEYGLIAAGISIAIIAVVGSLGTSLNTTFTSVQTALK
jgi:pilus assembly protein Flp/PilA